MARIQGYRALLHDALRESARAHPEKTALRWGDQSCTYAELDNRSDSLAASLLKYGIGRSDRVAVFMENSIECAVAIFGVLKMGAAFLVVNPQTKEEKLAYIGNDCGIRCLIADTQLMPVLRTVVPSIPSLTLTIIAGENDMATGEHTTVSFATATQPGEESAVIPKIIPTDMSALIYTSGSTGHPKGVVHTHQSMVFAANSIAEYLRLRNDDVILNALPMSFDYGLYQLLLTITVGATLVIEKTFTYPAQVLARIGEHSVTVLPAVPTLFAFMISMHRRKPLQYASVRTVTNTAAALPASHIDSLQEIFPNADIFPMYGLTECKRVSYLEPELIVSKRGSVGKAIPGTEVFLRSPAGDPVRTGEPGILHVRGPHLMRGYWNKPDQSREMLVDTDISGEKVLRTGDWFRMDEDGFLYFVGRSDDIIKCRGEKVSPAEVENALYSIDGITEAAVTGYPDETLGQAIRAHIVVDPDSALDERQVRAALSKKLEAFMMPTDIQIRTELPKSENGKIDRKQLMVSA